jgi:hypothetical protein
MEQNSSQEANRRLTSQPIPHTTRDPNIHCTARQSQLIPPFKASAWLFQLFFRN